MMKIAVALLLIPAVTASGTYPAFSSERSAMRAQSAASERSVAQLEAELETGQVSALSLTKVYLARIHRLNSRLHAVIAINPDALQEAIRADRRRAAGKTLSPLDGMPILVKDNIDVAGRMPTTAGSLALLRNVPAQDAPLVARLKAAGLVILGKANLSEWANFRSDEASSGWSATGGITRNPYALDRTACGSSSGSAVAVAADLAPLAIGTETDGSITCPAAMNGVVGLKPTVGLVSRSGIVPISQSQDTAGPMARSVTDAAQLLTLIAGTDPTDQATSGADAHRVDYARGLAATGLQGARIGVLRFLKGISPRTLAVFESALRTLRTQGAVLVDINAFDFGQMDAQETAVLQTEFKTGVNDYLAHTPSAVTSRSLDQLISFNRREPRELAWFGQEIFERSAASGGIDDPEFVKIRSQVRQSAGPDGIDRLLRENDVVALVAPTTGPAWSIDWLNGDASGGSATKLPAVAGYPHLTVPMGMVHGLPVGLSLIGAAWSEQRLLSLGFAFENAAHARRAPGLIDSVRPPAAP